MKKSIIAALLIAGMSGACFVAPAAAADATAAGLAATAGQPWQEAQTILRATEADLGKGGIKSIQAHAADLERVLADSDNPFGTPAPAAGDRIMLTDGSTQVLAAMLFAAGDKSPEAQGRKAVAMANPYPSASYYLGSYYNETGKPADALRVLDIGLALKGPIPGLPAALDHMPGLINERGAALIAIKQWPEALANFDKGLAFKPLPDRARALLLRGRGFALTELGRLDDAEQSYRDSLVAEPNNARAQQELNYIARIRAGGAPTATVIQPSVPQPRQ